MKRKTVAIVAVVLAVVVCGVLVAFLVKKHKPVSIQDARIVELFGGEEGLKTVTHPTVVKAFRLKPDPRRQPSDFEVASEPVAVPQNLATEVSRILVNPTSYWWDTSKPCMPRYGVRFSFHRGQDQVDVFLCYECMELRVARNGKMTSDPGLDKNFDPANGALVVAANALFPDDPEIQELEAINYELPE